MPNDLSYDEFLARKRMSDPATGMREVDDLPAFLFPHQRDITRWALRRGRAAIFAGTGLGKTAMELVWADRVAAHTGKPVVVFAPLAVSAQHVREADKFGIPAKIARSQDDVSSGVFVTNYAKIDRFDLSTFGGVVLDECFAPDTPIDVVDQFGNLSQKHIKKIKIGDRIINASGDDSVSDVHRREVPYAVRVRYAGREVIASPNHPFLTQRGWVGSQDIQPGDTVISADAAVRMVRSGISGQSSEGTVEALLRSILLSEMADEAAGDTGENSFARSGGETRCQEKRVASQRRPKSSRGNGPHYRTQPNVDARREGESLPPIESYEARTFRAWGQWSRDDQTSIVADGCALRQLEGGICFVTGASNGRVSHALQNRLGQRRKTNSHRGGWSLTPCSEASGPEKGREALGFGVEGVEVLELGHHDLDQYRDADGKLYFYDLGGTRHPSFSIHGALVHNSSILKAHDGKTRARLIETCQQIPFRLAATATPAPNDFMELGNHAEFLGAMNYAEMLAMFFVHDGGETQKWRLKGHAETEFWKWMASWSVMLRKPSDLGYPNSGYDLPPLVTRQHVTAVEYAPDMEAGTLFPIEARTLQERLGARRSSIRERVDATAEIVATKPNATWVVWCQLNDESAALARAIPGAVEIVGSDDEDVKERKLEEFALGRIRVLISKPSITGYGCNWQHCADTVFCGLNDSFEQVFQAIRRFWRFGQTKPVTAHFIASELEGAVVANLRRKESDAERMADAMVAHMADLSAHDLRGASRDKADYAPKRVPLPHFIG